MTATNAMLAHRYGYGLGRGPRRMPSRMQTSLMGTEEFGSFDDAVAADMFGADDDEDSEEDDDGDLSAHEDAYSYSSESTQTIGGKFKLPKLPGWALPAAAIAAGTAGAVGLGLALTSKKRKAKKAAREASEAFGAMGDLVADSMFGDPDDEFGSVDWDLFASPLSSSSPPPSPPPPPKASIQPVPPVSSGMPSWSQYKAAQRDLYRATKKSTKASERLAKAQSALPSLSTPFGGMHLQRYGWGIPSPLSFDSAQELQRFLGDLASQTPADLKWIATRLVVGELGLGEASSNQAIFTAQFEKFKNAVLREGGMGPSATAEANAGVSLVGQVKGSPVSPLNRQAMLSVSKATAPFIVRGLA